MALLRVYSGMFKCEECSDLFKAVLSPEKELRCPACKADLVEIVDEDCEDDEEEDDNEEEDAQDEDETRDAANN